MKYIFLFVLLFSFFILKSQNYILPDGEYMDTTSIHNTQDTNCINSPYIYFYSLNAKYPKSSTSLLYEVHSFLQKKNSTYSGSGYITFRFRIDCEGEMIKKVQVLQTDERYKNYHFKKELVNELYAFLKTLDKWKAVKSVSEKRFSYNTFITFKIKNGKIVNVIP